MARTRIAVPVLAGAALWIALSNVAGRADAPKGRVSVQGGQVCGKCHVEIFSHWKNDIHALALDDPIFKASYMEAYLDSAPEAKSLCLPCHAPATFLNNDFDLKKAETREGVSCDFCHSLKAIHLGSAEKRFEFEAGNVKRGPLSNASSPAHETQSSSLFKSSELCASCHQLVNGRGTTVLGTYSEWKASPYAAEGITCQACHMPVVTGNVVDSKIKVSSGEKINLHAISAAHSVKQLEKAVKIEIKRLEKDKNFVYVEVLVTNVGSGPSVPTGIPTRQLILWVELKTPAEVSSQRRTYTRRLVNAQGQPVLSIMDIVKNAAQDAGDTRLKPKESRLESFVFPVPRSEDIAITARIEYLFSANILSPTEMRVKMAEETRVLK